MDQPTFLKSRHAIYFMHISERFHCKFLTCPPSLFSITRLYEGKLDWLFLAAGFGVQWAEPKDSPQAPRRLHPCIGNRAAMQAGAKAGWDGVPSILSTRAQNWCGGRWSHSSYIVCYGLQMGTRQASQPSNTGLASLQVLTIISFHFLFPLQSLLDLWPSAALDIRTTSAPLAKYLVQFLLLPPKPLPILPKWTNLSTFNTPVVACFYDQNSIVFFSLQINSLPL